MNRFATLSFCLACIGHIAVADTGPRSAIPWLSDILTTPGTDAPSDPTGTEDEIVVTSLNDRQRDGVGILSYRQSGIPKNVWDQTSALRVRKLMSQTPYAGLPEVRSLYRRMLLAEFDPPIGASASTNLLLARIDKLLAIGALEQASALINAAGADTADLFSRWFDISLLTNNADEACATLQHSPMLSPAKNVRVFCLARAGDWDAAAVSLTLGETLGRIDPHYSLLLSFFLDPALIEEEAPPEPRRPMSALEFLIRESVGLPRPDTSLPDAFLHADLADYVPVRFRMLAAERLVRIGALDPGILFAAYREEPAASSGGIWERADAVQDFDTAVGADVNDALIRLDRELTAVGLRHAAATTLASRLEQLEPSALEHKAREIAASYLLLAGKLDRAMAWMTPGASVHLRTAAVVAGKSDVIDPAISADMFAILAPFLETDPTRLLDPRMAQLVSTQRTGEAIFGAIALLARDTMPDPGDVALALATLRAVGQEETARRAAIQLLLLSQDLDHAR